jgi:hypothetical protein
MQARFMVLAACAIAAVGPAALVTKGWATEGNTVAGPIGGTDMRSAMLPPPGLWVGGVYAYGAARGFADGNGDDIPQASGLDLWRDTAGAFLIYVPPVQIFGGSVGFLGVASAQRACGHLVKGAPNPCINGAGDPYVEADWSRFFGTIRPSQYPGAFPIAEGLFVDVGVGAVIPIGHFDAIEARDKGPSLGSNTWDFAPSLAMTYTTPPVLAEGTEFSAKFYWNTYLTNPETNYKAGALVDIDFAVTEHIGRLQVGMAGAYFSQVEDDRLNGVALPPDGRRATVLALGGVAAYDMPELGASMKLKAISNVLQENFVHSYGIAFTFVKKLD